MAVYLKSTGNNTAMSIRVSKERAELSVKRFLLFMVVLFNLLFVVFTADLYVKRPYLYEIGSGTVIIFVIVFLAGNTVCVLFYKLARTRTLAKLVALQKDDRVAPEFILNETSTVKRILKVFFYNDDVPPSYYDTFPGDERIHRVITYVVVSLLILVMLVYKYLEASGQLDYLIGG